MPGVTALMNSLPMVEYDRLNIVLREMKTDFILLRWYLSFPPFNRKSLVSVNLQVIFRENGILFHR